MTDLSFLEFKSTLRPHQETAMDWLIGHERKGVSGCILADTMGLGKTVTTLCLICNSHTDRHMNTLIVVPLSLLDQWQEEMKKHTNIKSSDIFVYHGPPKTRNYCPSLNSRHPKVVLTTYDVIRADHPKKTSLLHRFKIDRIVVDEIHNIRNPKTAVSEALISYSKGIKYKLGLTGTPFNNTQKDLYTLCLFMNISPYNTKEWWKKDISYEDTISSSMKEWREKYILQRGKDVLDLPEVEYNIVNCPMDSLQTEFYEKLEADAIAVYRSFAYGKEAYANLLVRILRLRQGVVHPLLVTGLKTHEQIDPKEFQYQSSKFKKAIEIVKSVPETEKIVIFSQWTGVFKLFSHGLIANGIRFVQFSGSSKVDERTFAISKFNNNPEVRVILITTKSGGVGLNLNRANHVIMLDLMYNPYAELQAFDRVHRIGQERPVFVHKLVVNETVETWLEALQENKKTTANKILSTSGVGPGESSTEATKENVQELFEKYVQTRKKDDKPKLVVKPKIIVKPTPKIVVKPILK